MAARGKDDSSTTTNSAGGETRLALVTGSTSGIGLAIAKALAAKGYDIVINGFGSPEDIQRARDECLAKGAGRVEYHGADLSDPPQIEKMFEYVKEQFSGRGPDVLVNNAGSFRPSPPPPPLHPHTHSLTHSLPLSLPHSPPFLLHTNLFALLH